MGTSKRTGGTDDPFAGLNKKKSTVLKNGTTETSQSSSKSQSANPFAGLGSIEESSATPVAPTRELSATASADAGVKQKMEQASVAPAAINPAKQKPESKKSLFGDFSSASIEVAGQKIPLKANIPLVNTKEYADELQLRINTKTFTGEDVAVVSRSMGTSPLATNAILSGRIATGTVIDFNDKKLKATKYLEDAVKDFNNNFTDKEFVPKEGEISVPGMKGRFGFNAYDINAVLTNPDVAGDFLSKYKDAIEMMGSDQRKVGRGAVYPSVEAKKQAEESKKNYENIVGAFGKYSNVIAGKIMDDIMENPALSKEQKVREIALRVDGRNYKNNADAIKERLNPVNYLMEYGLGNNTSNEIDILNSTKANVELGVNRKIKEQINYTSALKGAIIEDFNEKVANLKTDEEKQALHKSVEKELSDLDLKIKNLNSSYEDEKKLQTKYPVLFKQELVRKLNDFQALRSGNVEGEENNAYKNISIFDFLKNNGYDINDQKVKDVLTSDSFKDYSFWGRPLQNISDVFVNSGKAVLDFTPLRDKADILSEKVQSELFPTQVGEKDEYQLTGLGKGNFGLGAKIGQNIGNTTGQVIGQGLLQAATAGAGRMVGLSKLASSRAAFWSSGALTSYDQAYKDSYDFIDNNAGRMAYAGLIAISNAASEKIFPDVKIVSIPGVSEKLADLASKIGADDFSKELVDDVLGKVKSDIVAYAKNFGKNVSQETIEEVTTSLFEDATRYVFGDPNANWDKAMDNAKNTAIQTATGMPVIGAYGAYKDVRQEKNTSAKATIYNSALYHDEAVDAIKKGFSENLYDQAEMNSKISVLNTAKSALDITDKTLQAAEVTLTRPQKELYVANLTAESLLKKQLKDLGTDGVVDDLLKSKLEEKISNLQSQRQQLLSGEVNIDDNGDILPPAIYSIDGKSVNEKGERITKDEFLKVMNSPDADNFDLSVEGDSETSGLLEKLGGVSEEIKSDKPQRKLSDEALAEKNRKEDNADIDKKLSALNPNDTVQKEMLEKQRTEINDYYDNYISSLKTNADGKDKEAQKTEGQNVLNPKAGADGESAPVIQSAVIEIGGKQYEGNNHAEAILKAKEAGEDISNVDRQAEGKFKLSDGTIIDRATAKEQFGQDRAELLIPQNEAANQANKDYAKITTTDSENAGNLTREAESLLASIGEGSKPTFITKNLERIAKENGIEVTDKMSADDVIDALKNIKNENGKKAQSKINETIPVENEASGKINPVSEKTTPTESPETQPTNEAKAKAPTVSDVSSGVGGDVKDSTIAGAIAERSEGYENQRVDKKSTIVSTIADTFENRVKIEEELNTLGKDVYYHGSDDISYLNSKDDINTANNTKNAKSKYLNLSPKAGTAVSYSIRQQKIGEKSGVAAFKLKGKGYTMNSEDVKTLKSNEDYEVFYDKKKSEGYDYVKVPQDANDVVVLNNNAIQYVGKKINIESLPTQQVKAENKPIVDEAKEGFTEGKDLNRIFAASKSKYGEKNGNKYNEAANRLVNPNTNTIIEVRSNGVVVKEGGKYLLKPFTNTDANYKKWELAKPLDVTEQYVKTEPTNEAKAIELAKEVLATMAGLPDEMSDSGKVIDYAIDKAVENPSLFKKEYLELFDKIKDRIPTNKIEESLEYHLDKMSDSPNVKILDDMLLERQPERNEPSQDELDNIDSEVISNKKELPSLNNLLEVAKNKNAALSAVSQINSQTLADLLDSVPESDQDEMIKAFEPHIKDGVIDSESLGDDIEALGSVAKFLSEKSGKKINLKTLTQVSNELKQKETGGSQNTQSKKADGLSNDSNGNTGNAKAGESQKPKRTIPTTSNKGSNEDNKAKGQPEKSSNTKPEQVRPTEVRGQQKVNKPVKGDSIFDNKKQLKGVITKVSKPGKTSALANEPFVIDVKYENGITAINLPVGDRFVINPGSDKVDDALIKAVDEAIGTESGSNPIRMMGEMVTLVKSVVDEGVSYEIYKGTSSDISFVRVKDEDSGNIVSLKRWSTYALAEKNYNSLLKVVDNFPAQPGDLKGVTAIEYEDNGETLLYGTKNNKTRVTVKGLSAEEIKNELEFEREILARSKKDVANFDEAEKGMTKEEKEFAIKLNKQTIGNIEQVEKIVIPFYENQLKLKEQSKPKYPISLSGLDGAKDQLAENTRKFLGQINAYPQNYIGSEEIINPDGNSLGVSFKFYNSENKTDSKWFVPGDANKMVNAVEKYIEALKINKNEQTQPERSTAAIVSSAEAIISQAETASEEKEVDVAIDKIEAALNEVESKIGKLTESWSTEDIAHEYPNRVIGKSVKKEITKYAKSIAKQLGWEIPAKNGIYDNIAPAGGDVVFNFIIPGTNWNMYVSAKYEPEYNTSYDNYAFNGFFYRMEAIKPVKGQSNMGMNQWQRENIAAKEMAQILKSEAGKYLNKPIQTEVAPTDVVNTPQIEDKPKKEKTRVTQRLSEKAKKELDDLWDELSDLNNKLGVTVSPEDELKKHKLTLRIVAKATEHGIYKFADIVALGFEKFGAAFDGLLPLIKRAYMAFQADASEDVLDQMDTVADVRSFDYEKFKNIINIEGDYKPESHELIEQNDSIRQFVDIVKNRILSKQKQGIVSLRKLATELGIDVKDTTLQEMVELAVVEASRDVAQSNELNADKLAKIIEIYNNQPTISMRSAERIEKQQYSTPAPTAFLAGLYLSAINPQTVFEPSAGNGILVMNFAPGIVTANEIDEVRSENLSKQGFGTVLNQDALQPFNIGKRDGIIMNPPFGSSPEITVNGFKVKGLDEKMIINALNHLATNGRAAIIMGGHNTYDDAGRLAKEKTFFNYLYHHYNVAAVLNMDGQLYQKQGTTFPTRLIFINGVKSTPSGFAPLGDKNNNPIVKSFEELYNIVDNLNTSKNVTQSILQPGLDANQGKGNDVYGESAGTKPTNQGQLSGIPEGQVRPTDTTVNSTKGETGSDGGGYVGNSSANTKSDSQGVSNSDNGIGSIQNLASKDDDRSANAADNRGGGDTGIQRNNPIQSVRKFSANELSEKEKVTYRPKSKGNPVGTVIPSQMASEAERILTDIENEFGGIDNFVMDKLNYQNTDELFKALSAEQIDAVAMAIKQIELGQGMIIGDMTGVGKGRIAAAVVRYAVNTGGKPIFLTERPNLFSDLYRDLVAIGSEKLVPFIVNDKSTDSDPTITDEKGNIVHKVLGKPAKKTIFEKKALPPGVDFVMATYSQFRSNPSKPSVKKDFFLSISNDNVLIMDESHNVSGDSNSGQLFQDVLATSKGVTYLSATFAKRPDNMPVYAVRTAMQEANMTKDELVSAIEVGGVALQEVVSSQLVESGQMLRRERTFEGVDIKYEVLNEVGQAHKEIADNVTEIIRDVIDFQAIHVKALIKDLDKEAAGEMAAVGGRKGTSMAGVDNTPFASKVFNVIDQLLFSIKANDVADAVIEELKANRKPVIGFKSTMESFLKNIDVQPGEKLERVDFSLTLKRSLEGTMRYTTTDAMGNKTPGSLSFSDLSPEGQKAYNSILDKITKASLGITISPIDVMIKRITDAGYTVQEITGRSMVLEMQDDGSAIVATRTDKDVKKISRDFNNGNLDVIMINASGATGISLHASSTFKDQRQRVMIDGQLELDINKAVQKRGRIDRTGQVVRGAYRYIVSAIPAEQRLLMMFKSKLKSLDANTTSSQKSKESDVDVTDFLNKYGDEIVTEYLKEDKEINTKLLDPLKFDGKSEEELDKLEKIDGAARKVTGRVAILNSKDQEVFYKEVVQRYLDFMEYLESNNSNDLEVKVLPLNATTVKSQVIVVGKGGTSPFGRDSILESIEADVLKKPLTKSEIDAEVKDGLAGLTPAESSSKLDDAAEAYYEDFIKREQESIANDFESKRKGVEELATKKAIKEGVPVQQAVAEALAALEESGRLKSERITVKYEGVSRSISRMVRYFKAGEIYQVPTSVRTDTVIGSSDGIFLGFHVKEKSKNPYAPSAIKMRFAVNDGRRVVVVPLSKRDFINAIIANSQFFSADTKQKKIDNWDSLQTNRTRESRYIVTGNLLQAYGTNHGQLVSYTDDKGDMKKGLLMPEDYKVGEQKLRVPIGQAAPYLKDSNSSITTIDKEVTITRERSGGFTIEVPLSKQSGGKYFLDLTLRDMINERGFNQMGGRMVAYFNESRLQDILNHLQATHNSSIEIGGQSKPDVKFSAKGAANDFQTNDTTPATLESLKKKYPLASVVQSQNELPKEVRDQAKLNKYTVEGVLYNGKVYLVADNLETMGRAEGVYRHERIGHASVIAHLKGKLDGFARSLVNNATKGQMVRLEAMAQALYKKPVADLSIEQKSILGQEYIAQAAENPAKSPVTWEKIVAFVRQVLRDLGIKLAVSDKDVRVLLDRAAKKETKSAETGTSFSEKNKLSLQKVSQYANDIITGKEIFERFSQNEQRGFAEGGQIHAEASIILSRNEGASGQDNSTTEAQENRIESYAKEKGVWTDNTTKELTKKYGQPVGSGEEAIVWGEPKEGNVIKTQDTFQYDNLQQKLDGITLHNSYFPEAALKVLGFGRNNNGDFQVIVEQPFIKGEKLTPEEIKNHLENIGFKQDENGHFANNDTIVEDVHTGNAIKTPEGNVVVIDPIMRLNTPEQGYGGTRVVGKISEPLFSSKEMQENLRKAREQAQAAEESGNQKQDNSISEDLKQYAQEFIDYTKKKNADATADDVIGEMESERGTGFTDEEGVILFDYIRNQFEPASEPQAEEQPDIEQPESKPLQEADEVVIRKILEQQIDEKQYPAHFSINEKSLREAAKTQSKGQDDREVLDGNYVQAHFVDLKSIALNNARILQQNLGSKWKNKVVQFLEKNPTAGDVAQVAGLLNVISTDIFNEKNEAKRGKKVSELRDLQLRIDAITYNNARSASLALNQRRLYQEFSRGVPVQDILAEIILTPEEMAMKQGVEAALKQKYSDEELNKKAKQSKTKPVTPKPPKPKADKSSDIKKDLIEKGNKAKEQSDGSGNIKKVTLADKIKQAADALKGFKC